MLPTLFADSVRCVVPLVDSSLDIRSMLSSEGHELLLCEAGVVGVLYGRLFKMPDEMSEFDVLKHHVDRSGPRFLFFFFFQAEDGIRDVAVTGVQTCALPIYPRGRSRPRTALQMDGRRSHRGIG